MQMLNAAERLVANGDFSELITVNQNKFINAVKEGKFQFPDLLRFWEPNYTVGLLPTVLHYK